MGSLNREAKPGVPIDPKESGWGRRVSQVINNLLIGKLNNTGAATLTDGATSVTVSDARAGPDTVISLMQVGSVQLGLWSVQTRTNGSFVITRTSTTGTCSVAYALLG